ncbi:MAG: type II toxin-antitoxin system death-on-curing family toxin [Candidatus Acidiferrales bacterium]
MKDPLWIDERDALALHDRLLALEGGAAGMRDLGLLLSALARPQQLRAYGDKPDIIQMAAAYTAGIVRDHPFIDGNKRTGFVVGVLFLELNGYRFAASEEDAAQAVLSLAARTLEETAFAAWMRANVRRR